MLSPIKLFALKLAVFSSVLAYLAVDLMLWQGPVWSMIHRYQSKPVPAQQPEAVVFGEVIDAQRLNAYCQELAFLSGQSSPDAKRRVSALIDLVRAELIRVRAQYNDKNLPDMRADAEAAYARLAARATTPEAFAYQLSQAGLDEASLTALIETRLKELALLQRALAPHEHVSEQELQAAYAEMQQELVVPASRQLKHIFLMKNHPESAAQEILQAQQAGADFAALAKEKSEDAASAAKGGDLGLIHDDARHPLPELPLFGDAAIAADTPCLLPSRWGWHIVLAGEIKPAHPASFEDCAASLRSALESAKREFALEAYFDASIQEAFQTKQIKIYAR
ncbi:MAG: peptidylprolyl isomerase [Akkermansia sp.]